jgi:hypothetical protein
VTAVPAAAVNGESNRVQRSPGKIDPGIDHGEGAMRSVTVQGSGSSVIAPRLIDPLSKGYDTVNRIAGGEGVTAVDADVISLLPRASAGAKTRYLEGRQTLCATELDLATPDAAWRRGRKRDP